jgi:hypothetical protein
MPDRRAPLGPAPDGQVPRALQLLGAGGRTVTWRPGHEHPARPPRVLVLAVTRIRPPRRPLHIPHESHRTRARPRRSSGQVKVRTRFCPSLPHSLPRDTSAVHDRAGGSGAAAWCTRPGGLRVRHRRVSIPARIPRAQRRIVGRSGAPVRPTDADSKDMCLVRKRVSSGQGSRGSAKRPWHLACDLVPELRTCSTALSRCS